MAQSIDVEISVKSAAAMGALSGIAQSITSMGIGLAKAGIDGAINAIGDSISLASDKAEAASKVNVLFADSADQIHEAAANAATTVGMSSGAYETAAGSLGNLLTNFGLSTDAAAGMSVEMLGLAADMGSFNNADPTEVVEAMGAAFRGESEPIRRFGVMLDDATVKAKAMEMGLYDGVGALDKSARAQATYALILDQTTAAQGDFARTSDGLANQQRIASARMEDAMTRIGEAIYPIATQLMPVLADVMVAVAEGIGDVVAAIADWVAKNRPFIDQLVSIGRTLFDVWLKAWGAIIDALGELGYRLGGVIGLFIDLGGAIIDTGDAIIRLFAGDFEGAAAAGERALDRLGSFQENVQRAMGDTARRMADQAAIGFGTLETQASAAAVDAAQGLASGYASGLGWVEDAAADVAAPIPEAVADAGVEAGAEAAKTAGEIAQGLRSGRDDWQGALDTLKDDIKSSMEPAKEIAHLEAVLAGKAITKGLASTDPLVRAQAQATVDLVEGRLDTLKGIGTETGIDAAGAIPGGMSSKDPAVRAAATSTANVVKTQFDTLEQGARVAAQVANMTLSTGLQQGTTAAGAAGRNVATAWGAGVVSTVRGYRDDIAAAAAYATAPIRGMSPPTVGPLREIDTWGMNVGRAWAEGVGHGIAGDFGLAAIAADLRSLGGNPSGPGAAPIVVNVQAGVGDPVAIGRQVAETLRAYQRASGTEA